MSSACGKGSLLTESPDVGKQQPLRKLKKNLGTWMLFIIFSYFAFKWMLKNYRQKVLTELHRHCLVIIIASRVLVLIFSKLLLQKDVLRSSHHHIVRLHYTISGRKRPLSQKHTQFGVSRVAAFITIDEHFQ